MKKALQVETKSIKQIIIGKSWQAKEWGANH